MVSDVVVTAPSTREASCATQSVSSYGNDRTLTAEGEYVTAVIVDF